MYTVVRYNESHANQWNAFVEQSKNGTFLFNRHFMDYHADRFEDFSLMVFEGNKLRALLPAHIKGNEVFSHRGLTYGGIVLSEGLGFDKVRLIYHTLLCYLHTVNVTKIYLKNIPQFYFRQPSYEGNHLLHILKAKQTGKDLNLAVDFKGTVKINQSKIKNYNKRKDIGFSIDKGRDFETFGMVCL